MYRGEAEQNVIDVTSNLSIDDGDIMQNGAIMMGAGGGSVTIDLGSSLPPWPHSLDLLLRFTYVRLDRVF